MKTKGGNKKILTGTDKAPDVTSTPCVYHLPESLSDSPPRWWYWLRYSWQSGPPHQEVAGPPPLWESKADLEPRPQHEQEQVWRRYFQKRWNVIIQTSNRNIAFYVEHGTILQSNWKRIWHHPAPIRQTRPHVEPFTRHFNTCSVICTFYAVPCQVTNCAAECGLNYCCVLDKVPFFFCGAVAQKLQMSWQIMKYNNSQKKKTKHS